LIAPPNTIGTWEANRDYFHKQRRFGFFYMHFRENSAVQAQSTSIRSRYPEHFPPGTLLGPFRHVSSQHVGNATQILSQVDVDELGTLTEYANRFHHDTNPAWQTADINDAELLAFVKRTVAFAKKS
jgi:hypothetical protein